MKNKLTDLNDLLFAELERLQDEDSFKDKNGEVDSQKLEMGIKRADAVNALAGRIVDLSKVKLETVKTALDAGYNVPVPTLLQLESKDAR